MHLHSSRGVPKIGHRSTDTFVIQKWHLFPMNVAVRINAVKPDIAKTIPIIPQGRKLLQDCAPLLDSREEQESSFHSNSFIHHFKNMYEFSYGHLCQLLPILFTTTLFKFIFTWIEMYINKIGQT